MEESKRDIDDAIIMISRRNDFYRAKSHFVFGVLVLNIIVIFILIATLIYLVQNPTKPIYFVADPVSRLLKDIPNTEPNMSLDQVIDWSVEAVQAAYTYDFVNYRAQLQNAQKYFSDYGWRNYMSSLTASNNLVGLTNRRYVALGRVVDTPKLLVQGILGGAYAWKLQMPLIVQYLQPPKYDNQTSFSNVYNVTVIVQRQNLLDSYKGLAIVQMISEAPPATEAPPPEMKPGVPGGA